MIGHRMFGIWVVLVAVLSADGAQVTCFMPLPVLLPSLCGGASDGTSPE